MIDLKDCLLLGTITKTHGVKGQVVLKLNNLCFDDIKEMETVFIIIDGLPVPFFVSEYIKKNHDSLIIKFDDINMEEDARELSECNVYIKSTLISSKTINPETSEKLIGYKVIDNKLGLLGTLNDILDIQLNPLFRIVNINKEILLPIQPEFILSIDDDQKIILVETPSGFEDLV
ncbi:MAG: 16S rRNA processing protein RimM [Bacteroidales bacterium]|nr:16S rRNA processing protein RimM [Bacteroidales bacterium]